MWLTGLMVRDPLKLSCIYIYVYVFHDKPKKIFKVDIIDSRLLFDEFKSFKIVILLYLGSAMTWRTKSKVWVGWLLKLRTNFGVTLTSNMDKGQIWGSDITIGKNCSVHIQQLSTSMTQNTSCICCRKQTNKSFLHPVAHSALALSFYLSA